MNGASRAHCCALSRWLISWILIITLALPGLAPIGSSAAGRTDQAGFSSPAPFQLAGHLETPFTARYSAFVASTRGTLILFSGPSRSTDGGYMWEWLDTDGAAVNEIVALPTAPGAQGMLWALDRGQDALRISDSEGRNWHSPQLPPTGPIEDLAISPDFVTDRTVYAVSSYSSGPLWRSTDGGEHWQPLTGPNGVGLDLVVISPYFTADQTIWVVPVGRDSLWRSPDGGLAWFAADVGLGASPDNYIRDVAAGGFGAGEAALFVALGDGLRRSPDRGQTWSLISPSKYDLLAIPPGLGASLALFAREYDGSRLVYSEDLGLTWTDVLLEAAEYGVAFSPEYASDRTMYITAFDRIWTSRDGGQTWIPGQACPPFPYPADIDWLRLSTTPDQGENGLILAAEGQNTTFRSTDGGETWQQVELPLAAEMVWIEISPSYAEDHTILAVVDQSLYKSVDNGDSWTQLGGTLPTYYAPRLVVSPNYADDQTLFVYEYYSGLYRSPDDGQTWEELPGAPYIVDFDLSPEFPADQTAYRSQYNDDLFRSEDGGVTWTPIGAPAFSSAWGVMLSPGFVQDHTLFALNIGMSNGGVYRSTDRGDTWESVFDGLDYFVKAAAISPLFAQDRTLVVEAEGDFPAISEDAGDTWFYLEGMPGIGAYGRHNDVALTYEDGRLLPLGTTPSAAFRYRWPELSVAPEGSLVCFEPGSTQPAEKVLHLSANDWKLMPWEAAEEAGWLTMTPMSGTLPATLTLTIDPTGITTTVSANLVISASWSFRNGSAASVPIIVSFQCQRLWLPLVVKD